MTQEQELKYISRSPTPPTLPLGWSLGAERKALEIVDTYLDHKATLIGRGWALRRREVAGEPTRVTLKRNPRRTGALHQRDELEIESDQLPNEIANLIGGDLASQLQEVVVLRQYRRSWPLMHNGRPVAELTFDEIRSGRSHWCEMEIEYTHNLPESSVQELTRELEDFFARNESLTPSERSKVERAIAAL